MHGTRQTTTEALTLLGNLIETQRRQRKWSVEHAAKIIGINARTYRAIELGKPTVSIGAAFDAANALGVPLFGATGPAPVPYLAAQLAQAQLALLPQRTPPMPELDNDF
ncbi:helix-turn-helix transcriptional regulator [Gulosibacter bifidus]|uniref:Helix-turn-helix transcriptional regulator n=1 Tax=Gulosibacter bifidus TaxID=272239 RepID=A0ABW5RH94_9MICO|nr:helix-turn-helix transcriptional regulator [Gulosibacter bifidus]